METEVVRNAHLLCWKEAVKQGIDNGMRETSGALGRPKETAESFLLLARQSWMVT